MRTWGRSYNEDGTYAWVPVVTDDAGHDDLVWLTTLAQCLALNLGESPFFANYGIPQYQTIMTQVFPDYYVMQTQQQFSGHFASLVISRTSPANAPSYRVRAMTNQGVTLSADIPL